MTFPGAKQAACRTTNTNLFFAENQADQAEAKIICARCPVSAACLTHALAFNERGIWAGTTDRERRGIARRNPRRYTAICDGCSVPFTSPSAGRRYCGDTCRMAAHAERNRTWRKRQQAS